MRKIFSLLVFAIGSLATILLGNGGRPSSSKEQLSLHGLVSKEMWPFKDECKLSTSSVSVQYKCWAYEPTIRISLLPEAGEFELKCATVRGAKALCKALGEWSNKRNLYYHSSNIYLYQVFVYSDVGTIFFSDGRVRYVKEPQILTEEERNLCKDQLAKKPNNSVRIWEKSFEEIAKEVGIDCSEIIRDPEEVFNFSEDEAIRQAIMTVRKRVFDHFEKEGYSDFIPYLYKDLTLRNKEGPYDWMFFFRKRLTDLKNSREKPTPYDPQAYKKEYERLLTFILDTINNSTELKSYLKRVVTLDDVNLSFCWREYIEKPEKGNGYYSHRVYQTHSHWINELDFDGVKFFNKPNERSVVPIEDFRRFVEQDLLNISKIPLNQN